MDGLRQRRLRRRAPPLRRGDEGERRKTWYRIERGRIFGRRANADSAIAEFQAALTELRARDAKELVPLYNSKAIIEYSIALLLEQKNDNEGAREAYGRALQEDLAYHPSRRPANRSWISLVEERGITLDWVGAFVSGNPALFAALDAFARTRSLPASAIESFRAFAAERGVTIPAGADSDNVLQPYLLRVAASAKWGDEGGYLMTARLDPEIQRALTLFPQAAALAATVR
jgi:tetratricopeptide (TPR) repeat protein